MPFTTANVQAMTQQLKQAAGALLAPQDVDLYDGGRVVVALHVGTRRASESDITGGMSAESGLIATIDAEAWETAAGRAPQMGDVIWWTGQRYAVTEAHLAAPAGQPVFYKARLKG